MWKETTTTQKILVATSQMWKKSTITTTQKKLIATWKELIKTTRKETIIGWKQARRQKKQNRWPLSKIVMWCTRFDAATYWVVVASNPQTSFFSQT